MALCRDMSRLTPEHGQIRYCVPAEGSNVHESQGYQQNWHVVGTRVLTPERDSLAPMTPSSIVPMVPLGCWCSDFSFLGFQRYRHCT